jgi:hypothetical protein
MGGKWEMGNGKGNGREIKGIAIALLTAFLSPHNSPAIMLV